MEHAGRQHCALCSEQGGRRDYPTDGRAGGELAAARAMQPGDDGCGNSAGSLAPLSPPRVDDVLVPTAVWLPYT